MTRGLASTWFLGLVLALSACGSDSSADSTPKVPTVTITRLSLAGNATFDWTNNPEAVPDLILPCNGAIVVESSVSDWTARAPGGCGETQLCGHAEAVATAETGASVSASAVASPLLRLPVDSLSDWTGTASVLVRLVHDDGTPYLDPQGSEITSTRNVTFSEPASCDAPSGTGGTTSTGGAAATGGADSSGAGAAGAAGAAAGGASN